MTHLRWKKRQYRLQGYDYRNEGWYFVTICTQDRQHFFGAVVQENMCLSDIGQICHDYWQDIPIHFPDITLGEMVVMPNHLHGVIGIIDPSVGPLKFNGPTVRKPGQNVNFRMSEISPRSGSLSHIIRTYKAACTRVIRQITDQPFGWQPRFHDRIIRNDEELQRIEQYIRHNPAKWQEDRFFNQMQIE